MKKRFTFLIAALMLLTILTYPITGWSQAKTTYHLVQVTSVSAGELYVFEQDGYVMNNTVSSNALQTTNSYNTTGLTGTESYVWTLEASNSNFKMKNSSINGSNKYLAKGSGNTDLAFNSTGAVWSFAFQQDNTVLIQNTNASNRFLGYTSNNSHVYKGYATSNINSYPHAVVVYHLEEESSGSVLTITNPTGGTISVTNGGTPVSSGANIASGTTLTLDKTIDAGYTFSEWKVFKTDDENTTINVDNNNQFAMPDYNVTVTAIVNANPSHTITLNAATNGTISTSPSGSALEGQTVTITATPDEGYDLSTIAVTETGGSGSVTPTISGNTATFVMPTYNVTVSATFTAKTTYKITTAVTPESSGTITTDANAWEGKTVNVSVSPAAGYIYSSIAIKKTGDSNVSVPYSGNATNGFTFTMPAYAVTITATFATADIYALYSGALVEGDYVIYYDGYAMKNTVSSNRLTYSTVTPASNQIVNPNGEIVWHIAPSGNYWTIYNESVNKYAASTGAASKAQLLTSGSDDMSLWTANGTSTYEFVNKKNTSNGVNANLRNNGTYGFACYATGTGGALSLYRKAVTSTMAVASPDYGTITATPAGGSAIAEGGSITVSSGTTVTLSASGEGSYVLEAWDVYKTGESSTKVTVTSNTFTMPDYGVTVSASFRLPTTFTVQYSVNGAVVDGLTQPDVAEGTPVTLPTSGQVITPSGFSYVGWSESETSETVISGSTYTPADNTTLYLVFVKSGQTVGYNKVTKLSDITPGKYIIVNDNYCLPSTTTTSSPVKNSSYAVANASSTSNYTTIPANTEWIFTGTNSAMTIKNSEGNYLYSTNSNTGIRVSSTSDTWAFEICGGGFAMMESNNNKYCATYKSGSDWRGYTSANHENYGDGGVLYLYKKTQAYTRVYNATTTIMASIPATSIITVPNGVTLTLTGTNFGTEENLIIEDGGQLVTTSSNVQATFKKTIATSTNEDAHWYTISSPVTNTVAPAAPGVTITSVSNLVNNDVTYNLYRYVENAATNQWESYNPGNHNDFVALLNGHGYLYRNNGQPLTFTGEVNVEDVEVPVTAASSNNGIKGFNLLGNPYSHDITLKHVKTDENEYFYNCYILSGEGSWTAGTLYDDETSIHPCQGFFVQANESATATISKNTQRGINANGDFIRFTVANNEYKDVAYAIFDKGQDLTKINHRNAKIQQIYIPKDDENFAIATMADNNQSFNLNFKAMTMGQYTLSFKAKGEFNYLHVIDRMTGEDIDMLLEGEYSFIGSPQDNEARFIVRLGYLPNYDNNGADIFAYQNGSDIIVSGEGELQIFDVMGRMVSTQNVSGTETISVNAQGVYIFRLVGSEIKTQKIVVR